MARKPPSARSSATSREQEDKNSTDVAADAAVASDIPAHGTSLATGSGDTARDVARDARRADERRNVKAGYTVKGRYPTSVDDIYGGKPARSFAGTIVGLAIASLTLPTVMNRYPSSFGLETDLLSPGSCDRYLGSNSIVRGSLSAKDKFLQWSSYVSPLNLLFYVAPHPERYAALEHSIDTFLDNKRKATKAVESSFFFGSPTEPSSTNYSFEPSPLLPTLKVLDAPTGTEGTPGSTAILVNIANPNNYKPIQPLIYPVPFFAAALSYRELSKDYTFNFLNRTTFINQQQPIVNIGRNSLSASWLTHIFYHDNIFQWFQSISILISEFSAIMGSDSDVPAFYDEFDLAAAEPKTWLQTLTAPLTFIGSAIGHSSILFTGAYFGNAATFISRYLRFITSARRTKFAAVKFGDGNGTNMKTYLINQYSNLRIFGLNNGLYTLHAFTIYSDMWKLERISKNKKLFLENRNDRARVVRSEFESDGGIHITPISSRERMIVYDTRRKIIKTRIVNRICVILCEVIINILDACFISGSPSSSASKLMIGTDAAYVESFVGAISSILLGFGIAKAFRRLSKETKKKIEGGTFKLNGN